MSEPEKVPPVKVGDFPTEEQAHAVHTWVWAHREGWKPGMLMTAALANKVIDWFNSRGGE